jgi:rSAM/selenodomain-associated transferase 2
MRVSIVIPTLDEVDHLGPTLRSVRAQSGPAEVIVADGGSSDGTVALARRMGATVVTAERGRARQMNRGAEQARGDALLFLHADTLLPAGALGAVRYALADPTVDAGTFRLRFDRPSPLLRLYARFTHLPWIRLCFGDRGLFVRCAAFDALDGYPDWPLFEDLELARRLADRGGFRFLRLAVTTSARRFERNGTLTQQLRNAYLWLHYCLGTRPERVAHLYKYEA